MKQLLTLLFAVVFFAPLADAQTWQWGKRGGGSSDGRNNDPHETVTDMATDKNGNIYVLGLVEAAGAPNVSGTSVTAYGDKDVVISSFKCDGTYRWSKVIGGANDERPNAIATDTVGHVYVAMDVVPSAVPSQVVHYSTDSTQPLNSNKTTTLIQYDTNGVYRWMRQPSPDTVGVYAAFNQSASYDLTVEGNGDVTWFMLQPKGLVSVQTWTVAAPTTYALRYNAQGTMIDHIPLQIGTSEVGIGSLHFSRSKTGRFVVCGYQDFGQNIYSLSFNGVTLTHTMFLASFNAQGQLVWKKENTLSNNASRIFSRPIIDAQGNIYYSGDCARNDMFNGFTFLNSLFPGLNGMGSHPFIGKADSNGNHLWIKEASGKAGDVSNSLALKSQNEVWMSGTANSAWWDTVHRIQVQPNGGYPVYVARFNSAGNILSLDSLTGTFGSYNFAVCNAVDKNGNLIVGGEFNLSLNVNSSTTLTNNGGASDFFVAKFGYPCNCTSQPTSNFTSAVTTGKTVQFTYSGTTTSIDSVVWTWGDGQKQKVTTGYATPLTHTYTAAGTFNACANVYGSCGTASYCKSTTLTNAPGAVNTLAALGNVSVYPNPANTYFSIEGAAGATATLTNAIGQRAMQFSINADKQVMDISSLPAGMYILQLTDAKGARGATRIVKDK